jgi:hypothetical protein
MQKSAFIVAKIHQEGALRLRQSISTKEVYYKLIHQLLSDTLNFMQAAFATFITRSPVQLDKAQLGKKNYEVYSVYHISVTFPIKNG